MRNHSTRFPEILAAIEQEGRCFVDVRLERGGSDKRFRFGVSRTGYLAIKRLLQMRPFDQTPDLSYRYFFVPSVQRLDEERGLMGVRIEQGAEDIQFDIEAPRDLAANLLWFSRLEDWSEAEQLAVAIEPRAG